MGDAPLQSGSAADLLALGLGAADEQEALEQELNLGEFLCACPELELQGYLGRGGMGVVYRARQVRLDRHVAVKLMSPEVARDPEFAERFEREAKAMARLDHPGIVGVHDFGQAAGIYYIVMELVDGPNLRDLIEQDLAAAQAAKIVGELCDALAYAHDQGVVHRDIKPENVLLDRKGRVRIADFGLAKLQRGPAPGTAMRTRRVMGTPQYMAPEQIRDPGSVDHRTDIFAVGVVFYEMLTGQLPVGRFQLPSELGDGGAALDDIVLRALEANRDRRFQAASEICVALSEVGADGRATRIETFSAPNRWAVWAGGGLAVVGAGALAWQLGRTVPESTGRVSEPQSNEIAGSPSQEAAKPTNSRARWPAAELGILDASVSGVLGLDWSELRQAPVIKELGEVLPIHGGRTEHCHESILNHTNKVLLGVAADGKPVDIVVHADWDLDALDACLGATDRALAERDQEVDFTWKSEAFGPHRRIAVTLDDETFSMAVGKLGPRVVATLRPVTVEELDAMLQGETTVAPLTERVLSTLDLSAPVWLFAEPSPGLLPLGMVSVHGVVDLWNKLSIDATAEFADETAATSAQVLIESYANVIASLPNVAVDPKVTVTRAGRRVRARVDMAMPELDDPRLKVKLTGDASASLKIER